MKKPSEMEGQAELRGRPYSTAGRFEFWAPSAATGQRGPLTPERSRAKGEAERGSGKSTVPAGGPMGGAALPPCPSQVRLGRRNGAERGAPATSRGGVRLRSSLSQLT